MSMRFKLAALLTLGMTYSLTACKNAQEPSYTTHVIEQGPMTEVISASGEVTARNRVNIGSQLSGTIARVRVDFNDAVHAGDILADIAPQVFVAQAARAAASLAVAQAEVERTQVELADAVRTQKRHNKLGQGQMLSAAEVDKSDVAVDAARANVKRAQAAVLQAQADRDQAQANVALTQIRSPIDGVVLDRQIEVGQTVAAQFQVATLFVVVGDMRAVHVVVNIDEADVGQIQSGMPVRFHVDAYPQTDFSGRLYSLRQAPTGMSQATPNTSGVVTYAAIIEADNPNGLLMQGMTAQASIQKAHRDMALRLPLAALRFVPSDAAQTDGDKAPRAKAGGEGTVWLLESGVAQMRQVQLGISDGRFIEATSGVAAGDTIIVGQAQSKAETTGAKGVTRARR
jgi:HlyD family secretion protein